MFHFLLKPLILGFRLDHSGHDVVVNLRAVIATKGAIWSVAPEVYHRNRGFRVLGF